MRALGAIGAAASLAAFAGNSVLCRAALGGAAIDAATFSLVRFGSGAIALLVVLGLKERRPTLGGTWTSALVLFAYAVPFSYAYLTLPAGTGALLLFGSVQVTMMAVALASGERPTAQQWIGLTAAFGGLVYLTRPGLAAPPVVGCLLMITAGAAWGVYSLLGRASVRPIAQTAGNFLRVSPLIAAAWLLDRPHWHVSRAGVVLALVSGVVTTGLGYVIWYYVLPGLTATRAAIVQVAVPVLAALGGVLVMNETVTMRLALSAVMVLGGVGLAVGSRDA